MPKLASTFTKIEHWCAHPTIVLRENARRWIQLVRCGYSSSYNSVPLTRCTCVFRYFAFVLNYLELVLNYLELVLRYLAFVLYFELVLNYLELVFRYLAFVLNYFELVLNYLELVFRNLEFVRRYLFCFSGTSRTANRVTKGQTFSSRKQHPQKKTH